jgi:hypothetical protein
MQTALRVVKSTAAAIAALGLAACAGMMEAKPDPNQPPPNAAISSVGQGANPATLRMASRCESLTGTQREQCFIQERRGSTGTDSSTGISSGAGTGTTGSTQGAGTGFGVGAGSQR